MAKFKVGDKVKVKGMIVGSKQHDGEVGIVKSIAGTGKPGDPVTVEVHYGPNATWKSGDVVYASPSILKLANSCRSTNAVATDVDGNMLKVGDKVMYERSRGTWETDVIKRIDDDGKVYLSRSMLFGRDASTGLVKNETSPSAPVRSTNAVVRNALAARNAGIWESAKDAEDRSDVFVRAALGRTKYNFDTEAGTLREVIKLLASAEQTPKIKKNTEKLKGILSRVEKAAALFKGI